MASKLPCPPRAFPHAAELTWCGRVWFRRCVRTQVNFDEDKLTENLMALAQTIEKNRPTGCKGKLWNTAAISSTMGPGIRLELSALKA